MRQLTQRAIPRSKSRDRSGAKGRAVLGLLGWAGLAGAVMAQEVLPEVVVTADDTVLTESCRVVIPEGTVIADLNNNGVIRIATAGITVEFAEGSELVGVPGLKTWGQTLEGGWGGLRGTGIVIENAADVTLRGVRVRGYRLGVRAEAASGLTIDGAEITDTFHAPLLSTPLLEDTGDWLSPHVNDNGEWLTRYGAALAVKASDRVTVRGVTVRRSQNGIVLDRVNESSVYDNDASFLSGWGLALWRSSGNTIARNALDYNIRGHVEGLYNRGQDSAGLLMFEQCNDNIIAENSATHSGDGIFAFAGREAIGEVPKPDGLNYMDAGINGNAFLRNDLSYASAHGLELTFSERNVIAGNRFVENAICGLWGGYSSGVRVHGNTFARNGGMAYGEEHGGINAEHASGWVIDDNDFVNNRTGVHFWTDHDRELLRLDGVRPGYRGVDGNAIIGNRFVMNSGHPFGDDVRLDGVRARRVFSTSQETPDFGTNWVLDNEFDFEPSLAESIRYENAGFVNPDVSAEELVWFVDIPEPALPGETRPTERERPAAWPEAGRESIVMGPWRAWDFATPMLRELDRDGGRAVFELFVPSGMADSVRVTSVGGPEPRVTREDEADPLSPVRIAVESDASETATVAILRVEVGEDFARTIVVPLVRLAWSVRAWTWSVDPLLDRAGWVREGFGYIQTELQALDLPFGYAGPADVEPRIPLASNEMFGIIAESRTVLPAGRWVMNTLSDDGLRVTINGELAIDRWTIHPPTPDRVVFESDGETPTEILVEYFENTGNATLRVALTPGL